MKPIFRIVLMALPTLTVTAVTAQQSETTVVDTFSRNITAAINKVAAIAVNPKRSAFDLIAHYVSSNSSGENIYKSSVNLLGSEKTMVIKKSTSPQTGISKWEWAAVIATAPKGTMTAQLEQAKAQINSLLKTIALPKETDAKHHIQYTYASAWLNQYSGGSDSLFISLFFIKPDNRTENQMVDSLVKLYKPDLLNVSKASNASFRFGNAIKAEGISQTKRQSLYIDLAKELADSNIVYAYHLVMNAAFDADIRPILEGLPVQQRDAIRSMAKKTVEDFTAAQIQKLQPAPPVVQPTVTTSTQAAVKPKYKSGTGIMLRNDNSFNPYQRDYTIGEFNPSTKKYVVASREYVPAKKTFFKTNENVAYYACSFSEMSEQQIESMYIPTGKHYHFCLKCRGSGAIYKTETRIKGGWEQLSFNVYIYTPPYIAAQWEERNVCPDCSGVGRRLQN